MRTAAPARRCVPPGGDCCQITSGSPPVDSIPGLAQRAKSLEAEMDGAGRILLRYSGTESLLRVMIEGEEQARIERMAEELAGIIRAAIGT